MANRPSMHAPLQRRLPPDPETRSVEEVMLQRRLAKIQGETGNVALLASGRLPSEVAILLTAPRCKPHYPLLSPAASITGFCARLSLYDTHMHVYAYALYLDAGGEQTRGTASERR